MADVEIDNNRRVVEREVVQEPVVDNGNGALTILIVLVVAVLAIGAILFMTQSRDTPANAVANGVEQVGEATGDAAKTVERTITVETR